VDRNCHEVKAEVIWNEMKKWNVWVWVIYLLGKIYKGRVLFTLKMKKVIIVMCIFLIFSTSVSAFTIRERFGDDVEFVPSNTNTRYTINPDMELSSISIDSEYIMINGNMIKFISDSCYVHLGTKIMPLQLFVTETMGITNVELGGYVNGHKYLVDIGGELYLTPYAESNGHITFQFTGAYNKAYYLLVTNRYDTNYDGKVSILDLSFIWGHRSEIAEYNFPSDVTENGYINVLDVSMVWGYFLDFVYNN